MKSKEKNVNIFNKDVKRGGQYVYTDDERYSARVANKRQSDEIIKVILEHFPKGVSILDIGCGDGKYTIELFNQIKPKQILGIDPAKEAIKSAKLRIKDERVEFKVGSIYQLNGLAANKYKLAVVRGVLHHLYQPKKGIAELSKYFDNVLVLEPNGYNPVLKIIEKKSKYHKLHEEKSYWPPHLNSWFKKRGLRVVNQRFFCLVPYFCSDPLADLLKLLEKYIEKIPIVKTLTCGSNLILYQKEDKQ